MVANGDIDWWHSSGGIRLVAKKLRRYQISGKRRYRLVAKFRRYQIGGKEAEEGRLVANGGIKWWQRLVGIRLVANGGIDWWQSSGGIRLVANKLRRYQISGKRRYRLVAKFWRYMIGGKEAQEVSDLWQMEV